MIVAFACIRTLIVCKCSNFGICPESAGNVKSQHVITQAKYMDFKFIKAFLYQLELKCSTLSISLSR